MRREYGPEFDDTPKDFGRVAAATARQVIVQRLRDIEDDAIMGDFKGREGDIVAGIIQQSPDPRHVTVDFGTVEGILPLAEQVPGEKYVHGQRLRVYVVSVKRGLRGGTRFGLCRDGFCRFPFAADAPSQWADPYHRSPRVTLTRDEAWQRLALHPDRTLAELFAGDGARVDKLSTRIELGEGGIAFDWSTVLVYCSSG